MSASTDTGGELSRKVLDFEAVVKRLVKAAKDPGFTTAGWAPLAELADTGQFERIGTWMEVMNWQQYTEFLTTWAKGSLGFDTVLRRISELPGLVYLELEERHTRPGGIASVHSLTVFAFNDAGKIRHLDVYLQQPQAPVASPVAGRPGKLTPRLASCCGFRTARARQRTAGRPAQPGEGAHRQRRRQPVRRAWRRRDVAADDR